MADVAHELATSLHDDAFTLFAISGLAAMLADVVHEGIGHAAVALLMGAPTGNLSTVAWSSAFESRLVAVGGTVANLAAAAVFWIVLRRTQNASVHRRYFFLLSAAFNLFDGTGYFFFSGVTDFGDWAQVIRPMQPHGLWRGLLIAIGVATYYGAVRLTGVGFVRYLGVAMTDPRLLKLTLLPYVSAIVLIAVSALFNPIGMQLMWQSALPATAGAYSGLLWFRYYIPKSVALARTADGIGRSYAWIAACTAASLVFIVVLGHGVTLSQ